MKKKMYKWVGKGCSGEGYKGMLEPSLQKGCPKNTNSKCEIVEPKMVKIKAWAGFWGIPGSIAGGIYANTLNHGNAKKFPCTILIDKKYLKGRK